MTPCSCKLGLHIPQKHKIILSVCWCVVHTGAYCACRWIVRCIKPLKVSSTDLKKSLNLLHSPGRHTEGGDHINQHKQLQASNPTLLSSKSCTEQLRLGRKHCPPFGNAAARKPPRSHGRRIIRMSSLTLSLPMA